MERKSNARDRWLTLEEERLLEAELPWLQKLPVFAIYYMDRRRGEIVPLHWTDVDLVRRIVTVFRSKNGEPFRQIRPCLGGSGQQARS